MFCLKAFLNFDILIKAPWYEAYFLVIKKKKMRGFPGGSVVKNPPANAGDTGSIPDLADPTYCKATKPMHYNYWACALVPSSCNYWSPQSLEPVLCNERGHYSEEPAHGH